MKILSTTSGFTAGSHKLHLFHPVWKHSQLVLTKSNQNLQKKRQGHRTKMRMNCILLHSKTAARTRRATATHMGRNHADALAIIPLCGSSTKRRHPFIAEKRTIRLQCNRTDDPHLSHFTKFRRTAPRTRRATVRAPRSRRCRRAPRCATGRLRSSCPCRPP